MSCRRASCLARLVLTIGIAYAIALSGMLGGLKVAAHAAEARLAAQLGVICTVHGMLDARAGDEMPERPAAGKLACMEQCLTGGAAFAPPSAPSVALPVVWPVAHSAASGADIGSVASPSAAKPPPPRGPPILSI